jgi:chromosome segregation ATPase
MLAPCVLATCCAIAFVACLEFPAQAQQSTPQTLPSIESPQKEREKLKKRIKMVEDILKKLKAEREREKLAEKEVEERLDKGKLSLEEIEKKLDQGKLMLKELEEKLDQGKRALKEADERMDRGKLKIEELEAESERQKRKWAPGSIRSAGIPETDSRGREPTPAGSLCRVKKPTSGLGGSSN